MCAFMYTHTYAYAYIYIYIYNDTIIIRGTLRNSVGNEPF